MKKDWFLRISPYIDMRIKKPNILLRLFIKAIGWEAIEKDISEFPKVVMYVKEYPEEFYGKGNELGFKITQAEEK